MSQLETSAATDLTGEPEVIVAADEEAGSRLAAERIAAALSEAVGDRGHAHWATTGGSTPAGAYRNLANPPLRDAVPWESVELWWGDDRFVPHDHPLSNVKVADDILLDIGALSGESGTGGYGVDVGGGRLFGAPIPAENVHAMPTTQAIAGSHDTEWCAARYVEMLQASGPPMLNGMPVFDVLLLGVGADGHILSVFPDSTAFDRGEVAVGIPAPTHIEPHLPRVTLNPAIVGLARTVIVVVYGAGKANAVAGILQSQREPRRLPAQLARRSGATWILDRAAARLL